MLERTQPGLQLELRAASVAFAPHLSGYQTDLLRICGQAYGANSTLIEGDPENHWQEMMALFAPQNVFDNPQCSVSTDRAEWPPERSVATEYALNGWAPAIDLRHDLERCFADFMVRWTCGLVAPQPAPGYEGADDPPYLPGFTRLSPMDWRCDMTVLDWRKGRWQGHRYVRDIEDVIHEAEQNPALGWNLKLLRRLESTLGPDPRELARSHNGVQADRKQIVLWDIWDRKHRLPNAPSELKGYFGTWFTILDPALASASDDWVRKPRPAFNSRRGPYQVQGYMLLGDLPVPLSPLVSDTPQAVYLNKIARADMKQVLDYKRIGVTIDPNLADKLANGEDGAVYSVDGADVRQLVAQLVVGGPSPEMQVAKQSARETLNRKSGVNEAQRGNITGGTAYEVQTAAIASGMRSSWPATKFREFMRQIYGEAAFHFDMNPDVVQDIGPLPDGKKYRMRGGAPRGTKWTALDHEKLGLRIDPNSTSRTTEETRQLRFATVNTALATMGAATPPVALSTDWNKYLELTEDAAGVRGVAEVVDVETFYETSSALIGAEEPVKPSPQAKPQARFAWNSITPVRPGAQPGGNGGQGRPVNRSAAPKSSTYRGVAMAGSEA